MRLLSSRPNGASPWSRAAEGGQMGGNLRAAFLVLAALPLLWVACAKNNPTANDVIASRPGELLSRGGFIASGQRVAELGASGHPVQTCGDCHSSAFGGPVIDVHCPDCHPSEAAHLNHPVIEQTLAMMCVRCHMPYATLDRDSTNKYVADVRTHVFKLRVSTEKKSALFTHVDGGKVAVVDGGLTLDVACYQCHEDPAGGGGPYIQESMEALAGRASIVHSANPPRADREAR